MFSLQKNHKFQDEIGLLVCSQVQGWSSQRAARDVWVGDCSSSSSSSILYSVGGGYLLPSYIGKSSLSRFFRLRHFLLFLFAFHHLVHFFLTLESQDKLGHNWEEQLLGWMLGFGAQLTMFLCIIIVAAVVGTSSITGLLSRLLLTSKFPTCLPSILYEADSVLEPVLGVWLYTILQNCCLHRIINLPEC